MTYATIGTRAQRVSQLAFLRLLQRGLAYQVEAPTLWDVDFRTAVAQAELEDREHARRVSPDRVSLAPDGRRRRRDRNDASRADSGLRRAGRASGRRAVPAAVRDGGGDAAVRRARAGAGARAGRSREGQRHRDDLHVRRHHRRDLVARAAACRCARSSSPTARCAPVDVGRAGLGVGGRRRARSGTTTSSRGLSATKARAKIVEQLRESGDLVGEPRPITHAVKFYEKGDRPLEIVTSRQWFIKTIEFREALLARGRELQWHPAYMRARYENWVNGLNGDWCVSRQRFFGVPFPVWYPIDADGRVDYDAADRAARGSAADRSVDRRARRAIAPISAASPAGSSAIPTSWTPGRPRR